MTARRYKRLLLVLFFPLLLTGFALAKWADTERNIDIECVWLNDTPGSFDGKGVTDHSRFSLLGLPAQENTWLRYHVTSTPLLLKNAKILGSLPYVRLENAEEARRIADELRGKFATVHLSGERTNPSTMVIDRAHFQCDMVSEYHGDGRFEAHCWGGEHSGVHAFETSDKDQRAIDMLAVELDKKISSLEAAYVWRFGIMTVFPLFAFLGLSLSVWLFRRAVAYVKAA